MKVKRTCLSLLVLIVLTLFMYKSSVQAAENFLPQSQVCQNSPVGNICTPYASSDATYVMTARTADTLNLIRTILDESKSHLSAINSQTKTMVQQTKETQDTLQIMVKTFNEEFRKSITARFDQLPQEFAASPAIEKLKNEILAEVDKRIAEKPNP